MKECQRMSEGKLDKNSTLRKNLAMIYNSPFVKKYEKQIEMGTSWVCLQIRFREGTFWANYMQIPKLELMLFWKDFPYIWDHLGWPWRVGRCFSQVTTPVLVTTSAVSVIIPTTITTIIIVVALGNPCWCWRDPAGDQRKQSQLSYVQVKIWWNWIKKMKVLINVTFFGAHFWLLTRIALESLPRRATSIASISSIVTSVILWSISAATSRTRRVWRAYQQPLRPHQHLAQDNSKHDRYEIF